MLSNFIKYIAVSVYFFFFSFGFSFMPGLVGCTLIGILCVNLRGTQRITTSRDHITTACAAMYCDFQVIMLIMRLYHNDKYYIYIYIMCNIILWSILHTGASAKCSRRQLASKLCRCGVFSKLTQHTTQIAQFRVSFDANLVLTGGPI